MTKLIGIERVGREEGLANSGELTELMEVAVNFAKSGNKTAEEAAGETAKSWTNAVYAVESGLVFLVCVFENNGVLSSKLQTNTKEIWWTKKFSENIRIFNNRL